MPISTEQIVHARMLALVGENLARLRTVLAQKDGLVLDLADLQQYVRSAGPRYTKYEAADLLGRSHQFVSKWCTVLGLGRIDPTAGQGRLSLSMYDIDRLRTTPDRRRRPGGESPAPG